MENTGGKITVMEKDFARKKPAWKIHSGEKTSRGGKVPATICFMYESKMSTFMRIINIHRMEPFFPFYKIDEGRPSL